MLKANLDQYPVYATIQASIAAPNTIIHHRCTELAWSHIFKAGHE